MTNVDLKIAEALGIKIYKKYFGEDYYYPCIYDCGLDLSKKNSTARYFPGPGKAFWWSLTGPDAGNTAAVIKDRLADLGYFIKTERSPFETRVSIYSRVTSIKPIAVGEDGSEHLALREAAAKALKVEVEG